ncbi:MAG: DNA-binding protein, partial [Acidobacteria bacterium]
MKRITREWIDKAEADWSSAGLLFRARKRPDYDGACFHAQQSAEKYLKARLVEAGIYFSKTHNLMVLHALVLAVEPSWTPLQQHLRT